MEGREGEGVLLLWSWIRGGHYLVSQSLISPTFIDPGSGEMVGCIVGVNEMNIVDGSHSWQYKMETW